MKLLTMICVSNYVLLCCWILKSLNSLLVWVVLVGVAKCAYLVGVWLVHLVWTAMCVSACLSLQHLHLLSISREPPESIFVRIWWYGRRKKSLATWYCNVWITLTLPHPHVSSGLISRAAENLHSVMFYLVCLIPLVISTTQVLAWRPFSIRNSHTVDSKYIDGWFWTLCDLQTATVIAYSLQFCKPLTVMWHFGGIEGGGWINVFFNPLVPLFNLPMLSNPRFFNINHCFVPVFSQLYAHYIGVGIQVNVQFTLNVWRVIYNLIWCTFFVFMFSIFKWNHDYHNVFCICLFTKLYETKWI